ncbi:MAG: EutN/CcmL family microcompartment protein [Terriglobales bacterium]
MILAQVVGTVVATRKDDRLEGRKLLLCVPVTPAGEPDGHHVVSVDTVGAGFSEMVLLVGGSSARMAAGMKDMPVDSAIVGIVDEVSHEPEEARGEKRLAAAGPGKGRRS